jgi:hypothetical protein
MSLVDVRASLTETCNESDKGPLMNANRESGMPTIPTATDAEISAAAKQLGLNGAHSDSLRRKPGVGQVLQSLAHGRSHMVSVAIKPSSRRLGGSRRYKLAADDPISVRR